MPPPVVWRGGSWETTEDWQPKVNGVTLVIPKGTRTDLASVPRPLRGLVNTFELGGVGPPLIHDWIYRHKGRSTLSEVVKDIEPWLPPIRITRRAADRIFREAMKAEGIGWAKRTVAWLAVRGFGWVPWPPSKTTWGNAAARAAHTGWQVAGGILIASWLNFGSWSIVVAAAGLSAVKSLLVVPAGERVAEGLYK